MAPPEPVDGHVEGGFRAGDLFVSPQRVENGVGGDQAGCAEGEQGEQAPGTGTWQFQCLPCGIDNFDGSKQTEIHDGDHHIQ